MIQVSGKIQEKETIIGDFNGPIDLLIEISVVVGLCRRYMIAKMSQEENASKLGIELMTDIYDKVVLRSLCIGEEQQVVDFGEMLETIIDELPKDKAEQFVEEYLKRKGDD